MLRRALQLVTALVVAALVVGVGAWQTGNLEPRGDIPAFFPAPGPPQERIEGYRQLVKSTAATGGSVAALFPGHGWDAVVAALALRPGDVVADVGAGTGRLEIVLLERGIRFTRMHALETDPAAVGFMNLLLEASRLPEFRRVLPELVKPRHVGLATASIDVGILFNTPLFIEDPSRPEESRASDRAALQSLVAALRPDGRLHVFERLDKLALAGDRGCSTIEALLGPYGLAAVALGTMQLDYAGPLFPRHCWARLERAR